MADDPEADRAALILGVFTEIGILEQLGRAFLEARLDGVGAAVWGLMSHLSKRRDGRTPLELARAFQVPKTTMSHTVAVALKRGWVETAPNPRDARSKIVRPTDAGLAWFSTVAGRIGPDLAARLSDVPTDDLAVLRARLAALRAVVDARRDPQR